MQQAVKQKQVHLPGSVAREEDREIRESVLDFILCNKKVFIVHQSSIYHVRIFTDKVPTGGMHIHDVCVHTVKVCFKVLKYMNCLNTEGNRCCFK